MPGKLKSEIIKIELDDATFKGTRAEFTPVIQNTMILDTVEGQDILSVVIANTAQTELAQFLESIEATEWMRQAHERYHGKTNGRCPYCARKLDDDFEEKFLKSFDDQYEKNLKKLDAFLTAYKDTANRLYMYISKLPEEPYPGADVKSYNEKLEVLKAAITENLDAIKSKVAEPAKKVVLVEVTSILAVMHCGYFLRSQ